MRHLHDVVEEMELLIPEEEGRLIYGLNTVAESYRYAAPEAQGYWWHRGATVLQEELPDDPKDWSVWQKKIVDIWMGNENDAVK